MSDITAKLLLEVLENYRTPDPKIVGKLPKGGVTLSFVGHGAITELLIQIDPLWSWEPLEIRDGRPRIHVENGMATMWGRMTIHGKSMLGVGSVKADKPEYEKELVGDFIRNASMRFGVCLALWQKEGDVDRPVQSVDRQATATKAILKTFGDSVLVHDAKKGGATDKQIWLIKKTAKENNIVDVLSLATNVVNHEVKQLSDLTSAEASKVISNLAESVVKPAQALKFADEEPF